MIIAGLARHTELALHSVRIMLLFVKTNLAIMSLNATNPALSLYRTDQRTSLVCGLDLIVDIFERGDVTLCFIHLLPQVAKYYGNQGIRAVVLCEKFLGYFFRFSLVDCHNHFFSMRKNGTYCEIFSLFSP